MPRKYQILVCRGPECGEKRHSSELRAAFDHAVTEAPLVGNSVSVDGYSCFGKCQSGPNVLIREVRPGEVTRMIMLMPTMSPGAVLYHRVTPAEARRIVEEHVGHGRPITAMTARK